MDIGLALLRRCEAVYVLGDVVTEGMREEIKAAREAGIPIVNIPFPPKEQPAGEKEKEPTRTPEPPKMERVRDALFLAGEQAALPYTSLPIR